MGELEGPTHSRTLDLALFNINIIINIIIIIVIIIININININIITTNHALLNIIRLSTCLLCRFSTFYFFTL